MNFEWTNFYMEFANELLKYKDNRKELIDKMKLIKDINISKITMGDDIAPFSIFALFNYQGIAHHKKINILESIKNEFKIEVETPKNFDGIPAMNIYKLRFFDTQWQQAKIDIENLWNIFEASINYADNNTNENREAFIKYYNLAKDIKGVNWSLTMGLFWIRPFKYVNLDKTNREYIKFKLPNHSQNIKQLPNGKEYINLCDNLLEDIKKINIKDFPELSYKAWQFSKYDKNKFLQEVYINDKEYDKLKNLILDKKNIILQGSAGVGKSYAAKRLAYSIIGEKDNERVKMIQFHQSYSYEDFIIGYRPNENGFELKEGVFYKFCKEAEMDKNKENKYFLIIDEINRGNISKIFGELFMLIENDKRGEEYALELVYKDDEKFFVPENLYIIGLMNTADRSLAMLDYALRRRFAFYDMKPAFKSEQFKEYQKNLKNSKFDNLIKKVEELNEVIKEDLGEGFCIGHSYFCNLENIKDDKAMFDKLSLIIEFELIPLLKEYWFDDKEKVNTWIKNLTDAIK
ncbi:AAA family ATPase [uncultured Brachyspira sp.]|uniref:AAA family ATPase n=1 Tax=uncultured Brachyspira sp. TaxID=221953 RepID=UPI0025950E5D|nr:AAA family ATPase [uncultured Brachyspira sp.]